MTDPRTLTSEEIDDGWCLEPEAPPPAVTASDDPEPYAEYVVVETAVPRSPIEQAYWEQVEGKKLLNSFWDRYAAFGVRPPS